MLTSIRNAVYEPPVFEKKSEYELPNDVAEWNDEIMKQFFEEINYIPKEYGVDVVVNNIDHNKGYAKGSVVVFNGDRKINFPVVIKKYMLSPFDVLAYKNNDKMEYAPVSESLVKSLLSSQTIGTVVKNQLGGGLGDAGLKSPGGIAPKQSIDIEEATGVIKMSSLASAEDMKKLAAQLEAQPNVMKNFVDNTGDLVANIIDMNKGDTEVTSRDRKEGVLDLNNVIKTQQVVTTIDAQLFDVNSLTPIEPPAVCELRCYQYPSMEDFLQSNENAADRLTASRIGRPITGIVIGYTDFYRLKEDDNCTAKSSLGYEEKDIPETEKKRRMRNCQDQIFISSDGKYYSTYNDYDKTGIGFYGSDLIKTKGLMGKIVSRISNSVTDEFISINKENYRDGSDKLFANIRESYQGKRDRYEGSVGLNSDSERVFCIFGTDDAFECVEFCGNFKKYKVNGSNIYISDNVCVLPARVAAVQRVQSVQDDVYKMIIGKCKNIFLVPEASVFINSQYMTRLGENELMKPSRPVQKLFEEANINKVALYIDHSGNGYNIDGKPFEPLQKIAGLQHALSLKETVSSLMIMGMTKHAAENAIKVSLNRGSEHGIENSCVNIYGVNDNYINPKVFSGQEKTARLKPIYKRIAEQLRTDLVKEASALDDPEAVDVVLSLNFVNEDNLNDYIEQIQPMNKIATKLASMLLATRMGLSDVDEGAIKKSMDGLTKVIEGLEEVKIALGK